MRGWIRGWERFIREGQEGKKRDRLKEQGGGRGEGKEILRIIERDINQTPHKRRINVKITVVMYYYHIRKSRAIVYKQVKKKGINQSSGFLHIA